MTFEIDRKRQLKVFIDKLLTHTLPADNDNEKKKKRNRR